MQQPLQITFRDIPHSDAVEANVRERAAKLERYHDSIISCHVVVESPHRHHHKGKLFHIRIDIAVPNGDLVVSRDPQNDHAHEDVYVAIRDAFDAARRQLEQHTARNRNRVKAHESATSENEPPGQLMEQDENFSVQ